MGEACVSYKKRGKLGRDITAKVSDLSAHNTVDTDGIRIVSVISIAADSYGLSDCCLTPIKSCANDFSFKQTCIGVIQLLVLSCTI